ncbi:MAG: TetR/AcrR family transcriptional regulator [Gammaproteobacteria bacterium]|nr:TetR/AcrR family transcriptional regulator [Gammaproteobacteria bacterium]
MSHASKKSGGTGGTDGPKAAERRARILDALRRCILRQGYSATSFNELAQEAGMSPSHVFYYFQGKDAVLQELYRDLAQRLMASVSLLQGQPAEEQFKTMSDYAFAGEVFSHDERLVFTELIGQSLHNPSVKELRDGLATSVVAYLTNVFESCERAKGLSADNAGLAASALGIGLIVFCCCDLLPPDHARVLLHEGLRKIGGFDIQTGLEPDLPAGD